MRWIFLFALGCAHDVRVDYPAAPHEPTGTLVLMMSEPASGVTVAVNGLLVVDEAHTQHVVIENVPVGTQEIIMAANGTEKQFRVWIGSDHPTTVPLGVPDSSSGFVKTLFGSLLTVIVYSLLHR